MKPIWKSLGFWLGGLVTAFLLWAWGDSMKHHTSLEVSLSGWTFDMLVNASQLEVSWVDTSEFFGRDPRWDWSRAPGSRFENIEIRWFPPFDRGEVTYHLGRKVQPSSAGSIYILPFWGFCALLGIVWGLSLTGFRSWKRKRMKSSGG